ncbi:MAG: phosphate ABC transporter permease subunit PstC [Chloroflexi bacterium]|nr:phosphate ABC transporter permease subunit PstC [Chloroflexota bacterium]
MALKERLIRLGLLIVALFSISALALITLFIVAEGLPIISRVGFVDFVFGLEWAPTRGHFGILPMIAGSVGVTLGALFLGGPLAICCTIFLVEFAPEKFSAIVRPAIQVLAGIPSVVYGFWGLVVIVPLIRNYLGGPGLSILAGSIILAIMILPTVVSISEDSLRALPGTYKEGALALGANHWQTIWRVLLPAARSGIVASIILGMGRALGETMAVIMILGNSVDIPTSILDPARTLTTNIGIEMGYAAGEHRQALFATGVVLFALIMALTSMARMVSQRR